jgi:adenylate cyclase
VHGPSGRQDARWRFSDPLICHALTEPLATLPRQRLHLRIAEALGRSGAVSQMRKAQLAHHLYHAGSLAPPARAARALLDAGEAAQEMYATHDAIQHYARALEILESAPAEKSAVSEARERLADLLALLGEQAAALAHYNVLVNAYGTSGDRTAHARALRKVGTLQWQSGDRAGAMHCYERALSVLDPASSPIEAAHLYQELGLAAFRTGNNADAIDWARQALTAAEAASAADGVTSAADRKAAAAAVAHATNTIGVALARSGELDAAREHIERSVREAREMELLDVACRAYANLGVLYSTVEPRRAIDVSLTGLDLASRIGAASLQSYIYANLAAAYCALTERCESEGMQAAQTAADLDRQLGQLDHLAVPLIVLAQIHQCRGELQEAQRHYDEALALAEQAGEPQLLLPCYDGLATICLDRGDRARAAGYMEKARELCRRTGLDPDTLLLLPFLS